MPLSEESTGLFTALGADWANFELEDFPGVDLADFSGDLERDLRDFEEELFEEDLSLSSLDELLLLEWSEEEEEDEWWLLLDLESLCVVSEECLLDRLFLESEDRSSHLLLRFLAFSSPGEPLVVDDDDDEDDDLLLGDLNAAKVSVPSKALDMAWVKVFDGLERIFAPVTRLCPSSSESLEDSYMLKLAAWESMYNIIGLIQEIWRSNWLNI